MSKFGSLSSNKSKTIEKQEKKEEIFIGEYVGDRLSDGTCDGFGREVYQNRDQYEGEYRRGLRNGRGCYMYKSGAYYNGEWKKGFKDGHGKFNYPDGSEYCGEWKRNKRHGFGKYTYRNGDVYEGSWKENVKHGMGLFSYHETPVSIKGTWKENSLIGPVEIRYPNYEYHGYFDGTRLVGEGSFTSKMQYMLNGHIEMYPAISNENHEIIKTSESNLENSHSESDENKKCLTRFIAHEIMPYDYSRLPQQPVPLPEMDSSVSTCSYRSSLSCMEVDLYQVQSPILVSANPIQNCEDEVSLNSDEACGSP
ncbi:hypothetical protein PVAND_004290 [Polypedilum vanderplanki]|uniref:Uncharacterized protein n=1 Tax=Polypedilum vanderplanki TaxID=319348 RepID=A0A9J6BWI9_POLVA|nr:hypothetical protein PVAND_004290 [Polypedilum vanderplanki]